MKNRFRFFLLSLILLSSVVLFLANNTNAAEELPIKVDQKVGVTYQNKDGTYSYDLNTGESTKLSDKRGILLPDGNTFAYTINEGTPMFTRPRIYLENLNSKVITEVEIKISTIPFAIVSSSPNGEYLTIIQGAGYVGGSKMYMYNVKSQTLSAPYPILSDKMLWISNNQIAYEASECDDQNVCQNKGSLNILNLNDNSTKLINYTDQKESYKDLMALSFFKDKLIFAYSEYAYNEYKQLQLEDRNIIEYTYNFQDEGLDLAKEPNFIVSQLEYAKSYFLETTTVPSIVNINGITITEVYNWKKEDGNYILIQNGAEVKTINGYALNIYEKAN